jgi:3-oxoadipate enol-lactonase
VRALVLIDSQADQEDPVIAPGYEQLHQAWLDNGPGPMQEVVASIILGPGQWDGWCATWNEQNAPRAPDDLGQLTWPMDRDDMTGRLAEVTCPTLIVHGTADAAIPLARAQAVRDGLGGPVKFIAIESAAHASNVTHPDEVNHAILGILTGLDGGYTAAANGGPPCRLPSRRPYGTRRPAPG